MLSDAFLARLDRLSLVMRGRARGGAGGSRRSRQLGSSAEFSDYREYIPGDDIRRLDWNTLARFDKLFLKLYMEEQESAVTVLLDASASMVAKWDPARNAALAVGYLALAGGDRLRVTVLKGEGNRMSPQFSGRRDYARLAAFLESARPDGKGDVTGAVRKTERLPKGLAFLITDGYTEDALATALDHLRCLKQECGVIQVLSGEELDPALEGALRLEDSESGERLELLADRSALAQYRKTLECFLDDVRAVCRKREAPRLLLDGREDFEKTFIPLLSAGGMI